MIQHFWEDVEKARKGEFQYPESKRAKKQKVEVCQIQITRLDENGNPC
jgi:hypothetical protein